MTQQPAAGAATIAERPPDLSHARGQVTDTPGRTPKPAAHPAVLLAVLCAGQFLAALDLFIVNVALPKIGVGVHATSLSDLSWVLNAYAIVIAALMIPAGRLADLFGRKRGFLFGLGLFTGRSDAD